MPSNSFNQSGDYIRWMMKNDRDVVGLGPNPHWVNYFVFISDKNHLNCMVFHAALLQYWVFRIERKWTIRRL